MKKMVIYGWTGKILRIDLTHEKIFRADITKLTKKYLGGRGLAAKIAWNEIGPEIDAFDPENRLIIMTGPLTGTLAPCSGRTAFCGVAPQVYPNPRYTRSNMGGWFGSELKYAGLDGIVITGKANKPVYILIHDNDVDIIDANIIWGRDTFSTQKYLMDKYDQEIKVACIGPAGENLTRFGVILSETGNAAGQGGFGAVMGSKNLKAIAVRGTGIVRIAEPKYFYELCLAINRNFQGNSPRERSSSLASDDIVQAYGLKGIACSHACPWRCGWMWKNIPGIAYPGINTTIMKCVSGRFEGGGDYYNWNIGQEAAVELNAVANKLGLNHWSLLTGLIPWLKECKSKGIITEVDGIPIDFNSPDFWVKLMKKIAFREGIGDILAEDVPRAAQTLYKNENLVGSFYPAYGFSGHWDGHGDRGNPAFFPLWIVSALQWFTDTRDPFSSGHGYVQNLTRWSKTYSWEKLAKIGERVYGSTKAVDPLYPYDFKAQPAIWHQHESVLKDSLTLCDQGWPRLYSTLTNDGYARITLSEQNTIEGKSFEYQLYLAATGEEISEIEFHKKAERIFNLERAIDIRNYQRTRDEDLAIIPYFESEENWIGPSGKKESLDRKRFLMLVEDYYLMRGWDKCTGWPTKQKLVELDLIDVAERLDRLKSTTQ